MKKLKHVGIDIGSTTAKTVVLDHELQQIYSEYTRHHTNIKETTVALLKNICTLENTEKVTVTVTGSAGTAVSKRLSLPYMQEVLACTQAVEFLLPDTDVAIELGGEDAKITFFKGGLEQRMNGTCAGGTGAFIDQMAVLLNTDAKGLDQLAKSFQNIYPIASRCGVFAKTDIQPLLNDGVSKEDIAASIFQAVVNQTLSGLACGRPVKGNIAFLGGPLHFLPQLRQRFIETLSLSKDQVFTPCNAQLFVAYGAALASGDQHPVTVSDLLDSISLPETSIFEFSRLQPLFNDEKDQEQFNERHSKNFLLNNEGTEAGSVFYLGIDSGSTTTKAVLINENKRLIRTCYLSNEGNPLQQAIKIVQSIYNEFPNLNIRCSGVTGYGEHLIKAALKTDFSEIETVAHAKAAEFFVSDVDCIIDIGGQDMKCIKIKDGVIDSIMLNEACSSGCGSFIQTFAESLGMTAESFSKEALGSKKPVDLGSRCTVFMNSKIKQAQKEGASIGDLSAGLSYSVIKNALQKVMKVRDPGTLGEHIVVQGGTFYNDAVLRAFEIVSGITPYRPEISGLMGAFGMALLALEKANHSPGRSTILDKHALENFTVQTGVTRCKHCTNQCLLTVSSFSDGSRYTSGNRCEIGAGQVKSEEQPADLYEYRLKRYFNYKPLEESSAFRGTMGIPRALGTYEHYPFWHVFFSSLGFRVVLSSSSTKKIYEKGLDTLPVDTVCYPAKLMHGHIQDLIDKQTDYIFYPLIPYDQKEFKEADNCYNCPIVASYSEVVRNNMNFPDKTKFIRPCLPFHRRSKLIKKLSEEFASLGISEKEIVKAVKAADDELQSAKQDIRKKGEEIISLLKMTGQKGIVLSGRPYHIDPAIHHGINRIITQMGLAVLTEDSVAHITEVQRPLRVLDQWAYHSRLYSAAEYTGTNPLLEFVQLTSFGCGIDSVTSDQAVEILQKYNKKLTLLKIDEGSNLGAARIRLRSLKASMSDSIREHKQPVKFIQSNVRFTKDMKENHTILAPQMSPVHFNLLKEAMGSEGYRLHVLPAKDDSMVETGLRYVNNDSCYPSIIIVGQIIQALNSGEYDKNKVSVIITQSGGGCRQSNYYALIKKALSEAGYPYVPLISLSMLKKDTQPGFVLTVPLLHRAAMALVYGDVFMRMLLHTRPYEKTPGSAQKLYEYMKSAAYETIRSGDMISFHDDIWNIVDSFDRLPVYSVQKTKVGIVGEIFAKYHPISNNNLVEFLEKEGAEVTIPDLTDFFLYCLYNQNIKYENGMTDRLHKITAQAGIKILDTYRSSMFRALKESKRFSCPVSIQTKAKIAERFVSLGHQTGEGWLITGEMVEMIRSGVNNIVCAQPFACLPNHISGKSVFNAVKKEYPQANTVAVDYDPGASEVNQISRILLMLGNDKKNAEL